MHASNLWPSTNQFWIKSRTLTLRCCDVLQRLAPNCNRYFAEGDKRLLRWCGGLFEATGKKAVDGEIEALVCNVLCNDATCER